MNTRFAISPDGMRVAYDRCGTGPALLLLHGGGTSRQDWHEAGYVRRLRDKFTVITLDLRGHGESAMPTDPADYTIDKLEADILAVADACGVKRFLMGAMSYGGKVSRYLAVHSERVSKIVLMGTPLGPGVVGERRQQAIDFCAHWPPIVQAQQDGTLDLNALSEMDRDMLQRLNVPAMLGWVRAMLDWPAVEPADFRCPTLWLVGSEDRHAMASIQEYRESLKGSSVQVQILEGLDHEGVFDEIDRVFSIMLAFTTAQAKEITLTQTILTSPSRVYAAFTKAAGWCEWCCETAEADPDVGGRLHIYTEGYHAYGEFTKLDQDKIVAFTWNGDGEPPTLIHVQLDGLNDGTTVTFKVTGLGSEQTWVDIADFLERTWGRALRNLKTVLEAKPEA
jgi:pimeloyl-ACP methyl ester carboxylesterase/uncharacterized protein YndB with AHSA1/START domain